MQYTFNIVNNITFNIGIIKTTTTIFLLCSMYYDDNHLVTISMNTTKIIFVNIIYFFPIY